MCASTRIWDHKARAGKGAWRWVDVAPDHYFHAVSYMLIARKLGVYVNRHRGSPTTVKTGGEL